VTGMSALCALRAALRHCFFWVARKGARALARERLLNKVAGDAWLHGNSDSLKRIVGLNSSDEPLGGAGFGGWAERHTLEERPVVSITSTNAPRVLCAPLHACPERFDALTCPLPAATLTHQPAWQSARSLEAS
jgi:hypothetical protein